MQYYNIKIQYCKLANHPQKPKCHGMCKAFIWASGTCACIRSKIAGASSTPWGLACIPNSSTLPTTTCELEAPIPFAQSILIFRFKRNPSTLTALALGSRQWPSAEAGRTCSAVAVPVPALGGMENSDGAGYSGEKYEMSKEGYPHPEPFEFYFLRTSTSKTTFMPPAPKYQSTPESMQQPLQREI